MLANKAAVCDLKYNIQVSHDHSERESVKSMYFEQGTGSYYITTRFKLRLALPFLLFHHPLPLNRPTA
jgi:hypothetical protein